MSFVIAIDGPAASGKGTIARRLAAHYGFHHLDTGLLYRATAMSLLDKGMDLQDEEAATKAAQALDVMQMDRDALSNHSVGEAASKVAVMSGVRAALLTLQQTFSQKDPGTVLDGRDIASVICPDADVKLFITASPQVRATRRFKEAEGKGDTVSYDDVLSDILKRDERDMNRAVAPLKPTADAHLIDTSEMDIETAFQTAVGFVEKVRSPNR